MMEWGQWATAAREVLSGEFQFIRTSIWTSLALVSPAIRYGIIPANVIRARALLRSSCRESRQTITFNMYHHSLCPMSSKMVLSQKICLTMSLSSRVRWGLPGVPATAPFKRLYCVNRIFIVASRTSDKLCLICGKIRTQWRECHMNKSLEFGQLNQKAKIWKDIVIWGHLKWDNNSTK